MTLAERETPPSAEALLLLGDRVRSRLSNPDDLQTLATRIGEIAARRATSYVVGASPEGDRLAGAAALASGGRLRLWQTGEPPAPVLVVDAVLISGTQLTRAVAALRRNGAPVVSAAVVHAYRDASQRVSDALAVTVEALEPVTD